MEKSTDKIFRQRYSIRQTLKATVHKASISQITKPYSSFGTGVCYCHLDYFIFLLHYCVFATFQMKTLIFLFALLAAIGDFFTSTLESKFSQIVTAFAFAFTARQKVPFFEFINSLYNYKLIFFKLKITKLSFFIFNLFAYKFYLIFVGIYLSRLLFDMFVHLLDSCTSNFPYPHSFGRRISFFSSDLLQ